MKKHFILSLLLSVFLLGCSGMRTVKGNSTIPSGTRVSYERMMNPAFAEDYIGADVITEVQFYAPNPSNSWQSKVPKGHIVFQVIPLNGEAENSPFGGSKLGDYVYIPKSVGDIVFDLKQGDKIELRGGTRVRKAIIIGGVAIIEFVATSMRKL